MMHNCKYAPPLDDAAALSELILQFENFHTEQPNECFPFDLAQLFLLGRMFQAPSHPVEAHKWFADWFAKTITPLKEPGKLEAETKRLQAANQKTRRKNKRRRVIRKKPQRHVGQADDAAPHDIADRGGEEHEELLFDGEPPSIESWGFQGDDDESDPVQKENYISQIAAYR